MFPLDTYRNFRQRAFEVYYRLRHAGWTFWKRFPSLAIAGHVTLPNSFSFNELEAEPRGVQAPDGRYFSSVNSLDVEQLPSAIIRAIKNYDSVLRLYLGDHYLINNPNVWRNHTIPKEFRNMELFSQHWHYDKVVDFRNIQLFILLGTVTDEDGPLEFVVNSDEQKVMRSVLERNNIDLTIEAKKLTGIRGDSFLFSTGSTPHRAGIPKEGHIRDMFSVGFFPAYTKIGLPSELLLRDMN